MVPLTIHTKPELQSTHYLSYTHIKTMMSAKELYFITSWDALHERQASIHNLST